VSTTPERLTENLLSETALVMANTVLALRVARMIALLLSFGLATFCVIRPSWEGAAVALGFMLVVNLPLWLRRGGG